MSLTSNFVHLNKPTYTLDRKKVDIWQLPLNKNHANARALLNEDECKRADKFYFERHRRRYTLAKAATRLILGHYLKQSARKIEFAYNPHGKPSLSPSSIIQFNLSHSKDSALLAIGLTHPIGIDLEYFSARPYQGIGEHLFSLNESKWLEQQPHYLKPLAFFNIWAQKEAFIKACGLGLSYPTKTFDVLPFPAKPQIIADTYNQFNTWALHAFMPKTNCSAALCCHPDIEKIQFISITDLCLLYCARS